MLTPPPISTRLIQVCPPPPRPSQNGASFSWSYAMIPYLTFTWADVLVNEKSNGEPSK